MTSETTAEPESVLSLPYILSSKGEEFPSSEPQRTAPVCSLDPHVTFIPWSHYYSVSFHRALKT